MRCTQGVNLPAVFFETLHDPEVAAASLIAKMGYRIRTMTETNNRDPVLVKKDQNMLSIGLNRPLVLNSLNHDMVHLIQSAMDQARQDNSINFVLLYGEGDRGFCAGGDIRAMAQAVREGNMEKALQFLEEEYALDLSIHRFPKPVVVLADGITMGGGLGLSGGADMVLATERTQSAMPETRIGFFPDVGATGWMFNKCPAGYPEYLGLTGYEMIGSECVRVGFATHLIASKDIAELMKLLRRASGGVSKEKPRALRQIMALLEPLLCRDLPHKPEMDDWVKTYFAGKTSITKILEELRLCSLFSDLCNGVFTRLSERSPTALMVTLKLLRHNEGRTMEEVFAADLRAARFLLGHPDFLEGVRARLIDKDDRPRWRPDSLDKVGAVQGP
jgi:enoyl-CoA hydratase